MTGSPCEMKTNWAQQQANRHIYLSVSQCQMHRRQSSTKIFLTIYEKQSPAPHNAVDPGHFVICCVAALLHTSILCYCFIFGLKIELLFYFMGLNSLAHMRPEVCAADRFISEWFRQSSAAKAEKKQRGRWCFEACCFTSSALTASPVIWWPSLNRDGTVALTHCVLSEGSEGKGCVWRRWFPRGWVHWICT